jgi:hypothetical protein
MSLDPPPLLVIGSTALLTGLALHDDLVLVGYGIRYLVGRDQVPPLPRWLELHRGLVRARDGHVSDPRNGQTQSVDDQASLPAEESIGTEEAAAILNLSRRQVQNLAAELGAWPLGRALVFDRATVEAYARRRPGSRSA